MDEVTKLSGLELMKRVMDGRIAKPPIADTLDFTLIDVSEGSAVFEGTPAKKHYNPLGTVHGGYAATLLDSALGCAVHTKMAPGQTYTTLEIKVNYVRAMTAATGAVRAEGHVIHVGKRVATAEARLVDKDGKLYAHASTTCLVMDIEPR